MTAVRIARGATGRKLVLKFAGCYHGHHDCMLVNAGSGALTFGSPDSPGVPPEVAGCTLVAPYNDLEQVQALFAERGDDIAAVIVEPWAGNMGLVAPREGFLEGLRELTAARGSLLIFDEVISGFRVPEGGAQQRAGVTPDLTCLGKIIGGGLPVGAVGGAQEVMEQLSPVGGVYQAGTLSGNPLAMAAGRATLEVLHSEGVYDMLEERAVQLQEDLSGAARKAGVPLSVSRFGSVLGLFFSHRAPEDLDGVKASRSDLYPAFFHGMIGRGHYFAPSPFEATFVSAAHDEKTIRRTVADAGEVFAGLKGA